MVSDARQRASTILKVFVSTENTEDPRVTRIIDELRKSPGIEVEYSPLNPLVGDDPRWQGWDGRECCEAIAAADCFLAIETRGYDSSTWMAREFDVAWTIGVVEGNRQFRAREIPRPALQESVFRPEIHSVRSFPCVVFTSVV